MKDFHYTRSLLEKNTNHNTYYSRVLSSVLLGAGDGDSLRTKFCPERRAINTSLISKNHNLRLDGIFTKKKKPKGLKFPISENKTICRRIYKVLSANGFNLDFY